MWIMAVPLSFFLRRITFVLSALFLGNFLWAQLAILIMISIFMIILLLWWSPLESRFATFMEILNEETILLLSYLLMCFTDFVSEPEIRSYVGYVYICVAILNITVHLVCLLLATCIKIKSFCRRKFCKPKPITRPKTS